MAFPRPMNLKCVQSFIRLVNHFRRFVRGYATLVAPLYQLLKKRVMFTWGFIKQHAFEQLQSALCNHSFLIYPHFDLPFLLQIDASRDAIEAILSQVINNHEHVVAYALRRLSKATMNYGISDKEGLTVVFGVKHYRPYLHGSCFTVEIDHVPLRC